MAKRKAFPLRLDPQLYAALQKWAADEFRSVNGQIEYLLRRSAIQAGRKIPPETDNDGTDGDDEA